MTHRAQFIVAHPCNPPYHTPMVELVPAPWTSQQVQADTRALMQEVGQGPVSLSRELPGFVLNRMQYALLNECWRLIRCSVASAPSSLRLLNIYCIQGRDCVPAGYRRGDEGRDGDEVRLHGAHGDHPPQRGRDPELLRQIRGHHLQCLGGPRPHTNWVEVSVWPKP